MRKAISYGMVQSMENKVARGGHPASRDGSKLHGEVGVAERLWRFDVPVGALVGGADAAWCV